MGNMACTVSMSVECKGRWTSASYAADVLKANAKLSQSLREFPGMNKNRWEKKAMLLYLLDILQK